MYFKLYIVLGNEMLDKVTTTYDIVVVIKRTCIGEHKTSNDNNTIRIPCDYDTCAFISIMGIHSDDVEAASIAALTKTDHCTIDEKTRLRPANRLHNQDSQLFVVTFVLFVVILCSLSNNKCIFLNSFVIPNE